MQVEVCEVLTAPEGRAQPGWRRDLVQPSVQLGEGPPVATHQPGSAGEVGEHGGPDEAFEDEVSAAGIVHDGHGKPVVARVFHDRRLEHGVSALSLAVAAQHAVGTCREDVGGSSPSDRRGRHLTLLPA
jgi:hypothetical protein